MEIRKNTSIVETFYLRIIIFISLPLRNSVLRFVILHSLYDYLLTVVKI